MHGKSKRQRASVHLPKWRLPCLGIRGWVTSSRHDTCAEMELQPQGPTSLCDGMKAAENCNSPDRGGDEQFSSQSAILESGISASFWEPHNSGGTGRIGAPEWPHGAWCPVTLWLPFTTEGACGRGWLLASLVQPLWGLGIFSRCSHGRPASLCLPLLSPCSLLGQPLSLTALLGFLRGPGSWARDGGGVGEKVLSLSSPSITAQTKIHPGI